jgi:hypothetical protein
MRFESRYKIMLKRSAQANILINDFYTWIIAYSYSYVRAHCDRWCTVWGMATVLFVEWPVLYWLICWLNGCRVSPKIIRLWRETVIHVAAWTSVLCVFVPSFIVRIILAQSEEPLFEKDQLLHAFSNFIVLRAGYRRKTCSTYLRSPVLVCHWKAVTSTVGLPHFLASSTAAATDSRRYFRATLANADK